MDPSATQKPDKGFIQVARARRRNSERLSSQNDGGVLILQRLTSEEAKRLRDLIAFEQSTLGMPAPQLSH